MTQRIFLSRHGESAKNKFLKNGCIGYLPKENKLTEEGIKQSITLGDYLKLVVRPKEPLLVITSGKERTWETRDIVLSRMGRTLDNNLTYGINDPNLNESLYNELFEEPKDKSSLEWHVWDSFRNYYKGGFPSIRNKKRLGQDTYNILNDYFDKHHDKTILLILHDYINRALLGHLSEITSSKLTDQIDNCSLQLFYNGERRLSSGRYILVEDLRKILAH